MENTKPVEMMPSASSSSSSENEGFASFHGFVDIRQSEEWAAYLKKLWWKSIRTKKDISIEINSLKLFSLVKIQRPKSLDQKDLEEIENICIQNKALFIKIEPNLNQDLELFENNEYVISRFPLLPPSTIIIDLAKDENTLWKSISSNGRYDIKHAQKEGTKIEIHQNPSEETLKKFYKAFEETAKLKKFYIQGFNDLKAKAEVFNKKAYVIFAYTPKGELAACSFYLGYKNGIWFIHGGSTNLGRKYKSNHELMWKSILYFKSVGYKFFDLEGKDDDRFPQFTKNWGGFSFFKEKFGGKIIKYPIPHIKYLHWSLKFLAKVCRNLPL